MFIQDMFHRVLTVACEPNNRWAKIPDLNEPIEYSRKIDKNKQLT